MLSYPLILGGLAGILQIASVIPYVKDIIKGTTRPSLTSNILWLGISIISVLAQLAAGASWSIVIPIAVTFDEALVVFLCLLGYGYQKYSWIDAICLLLGLIAIVLWQITDQPIWALVFATAANFIAAVPVFLKTYREPRSEHTGAWLIALLASVCAIFATTIRNTANLILPIYFIFEAGLVSGLSFFGRRLAPPNLHD